MGTLGKCRWCGEAKSICPKCGDEMCTRLASVSDAGALICEGCYEGEMNP